MNQKADCLESFFIRVPEFARRVFAFFANAQKSGLMPKRSGGKFLLEFKRVLARRRGLALRSRVSARASFAVVSDFVFEIVALLGGAVVNPVFFVRR